ncbi:MAG: hypothetical protein GF341_03360 [candidate division Zixibacteria bacterium]|nr:hypothetical protein [candidate division Zixibacteria bacterium]
MNPTETSRRAHEIYEDKLKAKLEPNHIGQYVAIEIESEGYALADLPEDAIDAARVEYPQGTIHLIRVGFPGAFQLTSLCNDTDHWEF